MTAKPLRCYADAEPVNALPAHQSIANDGPHDTSPYIPRIDAHHHLWRYSDVEYGWISDEMKSLRRDFVIEDLQRNLLEAKVDGTVAVQARQTAEETRWLLQTAAEPRSPILGVVGWLPIADAAFEKLLQEFGGESRLCGLRHVVQAEAPGFLDGPDFNRGMRALQGTGLTYDLLIVARQLTETIRFVDRYPDQAFVLDHIGKPDIRNGEIQQWADTMRELARRPHVSCKVSGMVTEADWTRWTEASLLPYFDVVLEAFGPDRLLIGTDWPVLTLGSSYTQWWRTVEGWIADLSEHERAAILGSNAQRIYELSPLERR